MLLSASQLLSPQVKTVCRAAGAGTGIQGHLDTEILLGVLDQSSEQGCFSVLPLLKQSPGIQSHIPLPGALPKYFHL